MNTNIIYQLKKSHDVLLEILHLRGFTNIKKTDFYRVLSKNSGSFEINLGIDKINKISDSYSDVEIADLFALFNYNENLEIGMNRGNAANLLGIKNHTQISIKFL